MEVNITSTSKPVPYAKESYMSCPSSTICKARTSTCIVENMFLMRYKRDLNNKAATPESGSAAVAIAHAAKNEVRRCTRAYPPIILCSRCLGKVCSFTSTEGKVSVWKFVEAIDSRV